MRNAADNPDLYNLSRPIPAKFVKPPAPGKYGSYVPHYVVEQVLLATVGPFSWELVEILRGPTFGKVKGSDVSYENVIVGSVHRMTVVIDTKVVKIEEAGSVEAYLETNDGERLKKSTSDALKRAAMRVGVALHMWTKTPAEYFLPEFLRDEAAREEGLNTDDEEVVTGGEEQDDHEPDPPPSPEPEKTAPVSEDQTRPFEPSGATQDAAPKDADEAVQNLKDGGLVDPGDGEIRLPTGTVVTEPTTSEAWTILTKNEFVERVGSVENGKVLFVALARAAMEDRGIDNVDDVPDEAILEMEFRPLECSRMLEELVA